MKKSGTVFSLSPATGTEKVLYSFLGHADGKLPDGLVNSKGTLYGITHEGSVKPFWGGTVFSLKP